MAAKKETKPAYAALVKKGRKRKGLTVKQLADRSGLGHTTIERIELGGSTRVKSLQAVADVLGIRMVAMFGEYK